MPLKTAEIVENGNVVVTPGKNVDGPINVVVEDPYLEVGKTTTEVDDSGVTPVKTTDVYMRRKVVTEKVIDPRSW